MLASLVVVNKRNARELYGYVRSGQRHTDDWHGSRGLGVSTRRIHKSFPSLGEWVSSLSVFTSLGEWVSSLSVFTSLVGFWCLSVGGEGKREIVGEERPTTLVGEESNRFLGIHPEEGGG